MHRQKKAPVDVFRAVDGVRFRRLDGRQIGFNSLKHTDDFSQGGPTVNNYFRKSHFIYPHPPGLPTTRMFELPPAAPRTFTPAQEVLVPVEASRCRPPALPIGRPPTPQFTAGSTGKVSGARMIVGVPKLVVD